MDIVREVEEKLFRRDGKLNSPAIHSNKNSDLVSRVIQETSYLPPTSSFSQRWWHLKNGINPPTCCCGVSINWNNHSKFYPRFCSQRCAVTSPEARERTRQNATSRTHSEEQKLKQSARMKGHSHTPVTIQKLSEQKRGINNPQYGKSPWNKGLIGKDNPHFGKKRPGTGRCGRNNNQFGKAPSPKAGRGIWGKFDNYHFRSSLELFYLMFWNHEGISVRTAETKEFRVEYLHESGRIGTYSPDFYIEQTNTIVEIKPEPLHSNKNVLLKLEALKRAHPDKNCKLVGFAPISDFIKQVIDKELVDHYINLNMLELTHTQYERLKRNYGHIIRAIT